MNYGPDVALKPLYIRSVLMTSMTLTSMPSTTADKLPTSESSEALAAYVRAVESVKNEIVSEVTRNPHARSSLVADPVLTIASFVDRANGSAVKIPSDFEVKIIRETNGTVNLVIPAPDNLYPTSQQATDVVTQILNDAAGDPTLRRALRERPEQTLSHELNLRSGGSMQMGKDVMVQIHEPLPGEVIIELPSVITDRAPFMEAMSVAFDLKTFEVVAGTTGNECGYGSMVHTWCGYCGKSTSKSECTP
jgi:hypothetical protein